MSTATGAAPAELAEIKGPSAFGGGWRRFGHLLWLTSVSEFRLRYMGSALGYLWSLVRPLMLFGVLYVVFTRVIRFGEGIEHYAVLLLLNIVLFQFFSESTGAAVKSVVSREQVVRKMQFPRIAIPLSIVLTSLFTLALNLLAVFVFMLATGVEPRLTWLLLPVALVLLAVLTTGVSLILSSLYVHFRDIEHIWGVVTRVLFYATPILYPIEFVPEGVFRTLIALNPLTPIFEQVRIWMIDADAPGPLEAAGGAAALGASVTVFAILTVFGLWYFSRQAPRIAEAL